MLAVESAKDEIVWGLDCTISKEFRGLANKILFSRLIKFYFQGEVCIRKLRIESSHLAKTTGIMLRDTSSSGEDEILSLCLCMPA